MHKKRFYILLSSACITGYIWLTIVFFQENSSFNVPSPCLFRQITNIPCPSCGSTRAVLSLINGDISGSLLWNPFGIIIAGIMILAPVWIFYDAVRQKETLFDFYKRLELYLKRKWIALPLILLVLLNWMWNLYKGLP